MNWNQITENSVPTAGQPVVLRLKEKFDKVYPQPPFTKSGYAYGFVVAVLVWEVDGFGREYPAHFKALGIEEGQLTITRTIPIRNVVEWMKLA